MIFKTATRICRQDVLVFQFACKQLQRLTIPFKADRTNMCSLAQALLKPQARSSHRLFAQPSTRMNLPKGYSQRPTRFPWASMKQQDEAQRGEHRALHEGRNTPAQSNKKKPLKQQWLFTAEQCHNTTKRVDIPLNSNTASNVYKTTLLFHSGLLKSSIPLPKVPQLKEEVG